MTSVGIMLATNFFGLILVIGLLWLIALQIRDVSFIDAFWAFGMVLLAWGSAIQVGNEGLRAQLLLGLTTLWGLRLALHLFIRWRRTGEDPRYQKIIAGIMKKRHWGWEVTALVSVFLTQAPLLFITSLPAQIGIWASAAAPASEIGVLGWIGVAAALTGIAFESIGDAQLHAFRNNPDNHGKILDTGLWRYTRHPNYFGDALTWWGIFLVAADAAWWVAAASVIGPLFLSFTLTKWSGKALLECGMKHTRPGYDDYVARTSGFIPWPPKKRGA
jgi:steroid 5-alpha reductase family enzyme